MMTRVLWAAAPALAVAVVGSTVGIVGAQADPLPYGPETCINGFVWRNARDGDAVCVTPATRDLVAQENGDPGAHKDPNGAYGPQSCAQGFVWRQAFDGDTICVTPDIRSATLSDNGAAASRKAANQQPKDAISVNIEQSPTSVAVNVRNTSTTPGQCTYDANPTNGVFLPAVHRDFHVNPSDATKLDFLAPPAGITYHIVVSCRGTFNGQNVEIGHFQQDVTGGL